MTKRELNRIMQTIKKRQAGVAIERDKLDAAIDELEALRESCDRAFDALQDARDALSELV
jgi:hypothetical protein